jgi:hypothetical protein
MLTKVVAESGDAEVIGIPQPLKQKVQIAVEPVSSSGTVTITVRGAGESTYKALTDGTIDLSAPHTITVDGKLVAVKAESSSLDYTLIVSGT